MKSGEADGHGDGEGERVVAPDALGEPLVVPGEAALHDPSTGEKNETTPVERGPFDRRPFQVPRVMVGGTGSEPVIPTVSLPE